MPGGKLTARAQGKNRAYFLPLLKQKQNGYNLQQAKKLLPLLPAEL